MFPLTSSSNSTSKGKEKEQQSDPLINEINPFLKIDYTNPLLTTITSLTFFLLSKKLWYRFGKRIKNSDYLVGNWVGNNGKKRVKGVCTSVGDADNFRLFHRPVLRRFMKIPSNKSELKDQTIHVRLAGVDAPECAHFGNPAQPYSKEALEWLTSKVLHKTIQVDLFSKDRYGRVVGMAYTRPFPWIRKHNISEEMLKVGLATVYTLGGAQYGGLKSKFDALETKARAQKKGMWALKGKAYESPGDYKKRVGSSGGV